MYCNSKNGSCFKRSIQSGNQILYYKNYGVREYWIVDPGRKQVFIISLVCLEGDISHSRNRLLFCKHHIFPVRPVDRDRRDFFRIHQTVEYFQESTVHAVASHDDIIDICIFRLIDGTIRVSDNQLLCCPARNRASNRMPTGEMCAVYPASLVYVSEGTKLSGVNVILCSSSVAAFPFSPISYPECMI